MNQEELRLHRCCFTGHRPDKMELGEKDIKPLLEKTIDDAIADGYRAFITGMAMGTDIWAAEIVLERKKANKDVHLICALPHPNFERRRSITEKMRFNQIIKNADIVKEINDHYFGRFTPVKYEPKDAKRYFEHRRIGMGGVDWNGVISALKKIGYEGAIIVESVDEGNKYMPSKWNLAKACYGDVKTLVSNIRTNANWHKKSVDKKGFYHVVSTKRDETNVAEMFRLNLDSGDSYELSSDNLEMNVLVVKGKIKIDGSGLLDDLNHLDSFYIPGKSKINITAIEDCSLYIGAAPCDGYGKPLVRKMDFSLPIGDIHQIHGEGSGSREVMFTLAPQDSASRLICGVTWSGDGAWTSWKPHQHEKDLEEVYCYFDIKDDKYGLHYSYNTDETFDDAEAYVIRNGSMVVAPNGYHPTCAIPGCKNVYFWVLAAHSHNSRSYELAITDPNM